MYDGVKENFIMIDRQPDSLSLSVSLSLFHESSFCHVVVERLLKPGQFQRPLLTVSLDGMLVGCSGRPGGSR